MRQDYQWTDVSASLRKGRLYVKAPREKAIYLVQELASQDQDLSPKKILESPKAFVFVGFVDDWNEDLATLKVMTPSVIVTEFIRAIEAGLRNDLQVDWVSRVGGPPREEADALESLSEDRRSPEAFLF